MKKIFITGISTEVGKTIVSAIVTEALQADYWKPIQVIRRKLRNWFQINIQSFIQIAMHCKLR